MNIKKTATLKWEDAPDTITPEIYAQIRGISVQSARDEFNRKDFPVLTSGGSKLIADKTAIYMYELGLNPKSNTKQCVEYLILLELKKFNEKFNNIKSESI